MENEVNFKKILKWAGIVALIAVPVYLVLRKKKSETPEMPEMYAEDDSNIFASELEE